MDVLCVGGSEDDDATTTPHAPHEKTDREAERDKNVR